MLTRNPNYWGPAPYFQQVILDGVKDAQTQRLQLQKGDADMAFGLTTDQVRAEVRSWGQGCRWTHARLRLSGDERQPGRSPSHYPIPLVRQAIRYAIDYNGIIKNLLNGDGCSTRHVIPIGYVGNSPAQNAAQRIKTDPAKAKTLLAQAGYPNGFTMSITYPTNYPFDGVNFDTLAPR